MPYVSLLSSIHSDIADKIGGWQNCWHCWVSCLDRQRWMEHLSQLHRLCEIEHDMGALYSPLVSWLSSALIQYVAPVTQQMQLSRCCETGRRKKKKLVRGIGLTGSICGRMLRFSVFTSDGFLYLDWPTLPFWRKLCSDLSLVISIHQFDFLRVNRLNALNPGHKDQNKYPWVKKEKAWKHVCKKREDTGGMDSGGATRG